MWHKSATTLVVTEALKACLPLELRNTKGQALVATMNQFE